MKFPYPFLVAALLVAAMPALAQAPTQAAASPKATAPPQPAAAQAQTTEPPRTAVPAPGTTPIDRIAAVVDEDIVLQSEVDRAVAIIQAQYAQSSQQLPPPEVLRKQVLERLVLLKLQIARANEGGIRISDGELEQAVATVAQQNQLTSDQLQQRLAADGQSYEAFRRDLRDELLVQRLRQSVTRSRVVISDSEVDAALAAGTATPEQVHIAHIQVALPDGATPEQVQIAQTKVDGVKKLIDSGEMDFAAAAARYSDSPNALEGGDLGWRSYDEVPGLFASMLRSMQPGQVSDPTRGPSGFQLLKMIEKRESQRQTATEFHARAILIRNNEVVSLEQAKQKIDQARVRITGGEDFAKVAKEASDDTSTRNQGGDMGWFQQNGWGSAIGEQIVALGDDEISQPFQSDVGWHLLQRLGSREQDVTDELRRNQAREAIGRRKAEEEYERFLRQMRGEAYVDLRLPDGTAS